MIRIESVLGSVFEGSYTLAEHGRASGNAHQLGGGQLLIERIRPRISGRAHLMGEGRLLIEDDDPFAWGIQA